MQLGLKNRSVLVMAGSRGIGLAAARGFHAEGANVTICARSAEALDAAAKMMPGCQAIRGDVADPADIERITQAAASRFGPVEILVNNAGGPPAGAFDALADADWDAAVRLTLMSALRAARAVLPAMRSQRWGRIIMVSSYGVKQPVPGLTLSNTVRMAVLGWAKTLAGQVAADNVLVNTVCPGWTRTDRVTSLLAARANAENRTESEIAEDLAALVPLGRIGEPEEIAALIVFLGSGAASYITGTAIQVDGGVVQGYA